MNRVVFFSYKIGRQILTGGTRVQHATFRFSFFYLANNTPKHVFYCKNPLCLIGTREILKRPISVKELNVFLVVSVFTTKNCLKPLDQSVELIAFPSATEN